MKISDIAVDPQIVEKGGWVSNIPELENVRLKCRGSNNRDWRTRSFAEINGLSRKKRLDPVEQDKITEMLILDHGLLDWEGIEDEAGQPVPYDKKKAAEYLKYPKFLEGVIYACNQVANGIVDDVEAIAGN